MKFYFLFLLPVLFFVACGEEPTPEPVAVVEVMPEPTPEPIVLPKFPLSMELIHKHSLSSQEICDLQLYISSDIDLQRKIPASSSNVSNGTLIVSKQDRIHRILIKEGTPCIAIEAEDNYIIVKFSEDFELTFMYTRGKKDLFLLTANKWNDGDGSLVVNGKEYQAVGTSGQAYLMLNKTEIDSTDNNVIVLEGSTF